MTTMTAATEITVASLEAGVLKTMSAGLVFYRDPSKPSQGIYIALGTDNDTPWATADYGFSGVNPDWKALSADVVEYLHGIDQSTLEDAVRRPGDSINILDLMDEDD